MIIDRYSIRPLIELTRTEQLMVLEWRNHSKVREWMYNTEIISTASHFNFLESLKNDTTNKYFLVQKEYQNIGVIYYNKINTLDKSLYLGLYTNPLEQQKGNGHHLLRIAIDYAFNTLKTVCIKLEVLRHNTVAIHLYKKFNFKVIKEKHDILHMELQHENR